MKRIIVFALVFLTLRVGCPSGRSADEVPAVQPELNQESSFKKGAPHTARTKPSGRHPRDEARMSSRPEDGYLPSGVWRIRSAQNTVYLAATPDVMSEDQIPFPSPFYAAYRDSQEIYVEFDTDLSLFAQIRLVPTLTKWMKPHLGEFTYPKGRTLKDFLSA